VQLGAVTIKDVARAAGVSVASVSRALNGQDTVTEETRRRIVAVATRLRYLPHAAARSLSTRRTQTVGALLPDIYGEFFSELIRGIDRAARRRGLHLLVSSSHGDAEEAAAALRAMQGRVDGLLVMSPYVDAGLLAANLPHALPVVLLNTPEKRNPHPSLTFDNRAGALAMMTHLIGCGHRRIAFVTGPEANIDGQERLRGYREALVKLLPGAAEWIVPGDFSEESGLNAARSLLREPTRPDAVFCANDMMAVGCLYAFKEAGLQVPQDIAVAGFDDIPLARLVSPALTTVRVRIAEIGEQALERLAADIENPDSKRKPAASSVKPELVVRSSSGAEHARAISK
jgi:LacI family transcriptional regulator